jgi:hypothetical protein
MPSKKQDLVRQLESKIESQQKGPNVAGRFGQGASSQLDRKEQRRRDAAAGLVAFACKLPSELAEQVRQRAAQHEGGLNGLVEELLRAGLVNKA